MRKFYPFLLSLVFISCHSTRFEYVGSQEAPTTRVDIFVDEKAITRPYLVIGKGYEVPGLGGHLNREKMMAKALEKARKNGADAVFYKDQFIPRPGTQVSSQTRTDSIGRALITSTQTAVIPVDGYWYHEILFLKYR